MWARFVNCFLGLALMVIPALFGFSKTASDVNYIAGPLIMSFAIIAMWEFDQNVRWCNLVIGAGLVITPLILSFSRVELITDLVIGVLVILFSLVKTIPEKSYGGGWRSLFQKNPEHMRD